MVPIEEEIEKGIDQNARYIYENVTYKNTPLPDASVKGSQFKKPLFEFSGACAGCGETPYIKLLTQLYGENMIVANATGCSSIYTASAPSTAMTTNSCGRGPAWASSLFEDNAEYGYGLFEGSETVRREALTLISQAINKKIGSEQLQNELNIFFNEQNDENMRKLIEVLEKEKMNNEVLAKIYNYRRYLLKKSIWIIGGDGWAYDIGYGGLDHVLASGVNVNVLVLDTEVYSNTGGQASKATPLGGIAKFAAGGKRTNKKDLAALMMTYENVYVAKISMGANQNQTIKAFKEAYEYDGPSLIIAYCPCIEHGQKGGLSSQNEEKLAVEVGYWNLLRYNPSLIEKGKNPLQIDFKRPNWDKYQDFLMNENRFSRLVKENPSEAERILEINKKDAIKRFEYYERLSKLEY